MQAKHELSPYAEATAPSEQPGYGMEAAGQEQMMGMDDHAHKKKSVLGKVKDKAKKLTTKIKKPKSPGSAGNGDESSSQEEDGSDHNQQLGNQFGGENEEGIVASHGLTLEAIPTAYKKLQEEVPSAPGKVSAGGEAPYLAAPDFGESPHTKPTDESRAIPVEEDGENVEGKDLLGTLRSAGHEDAAAMDYGKPLSDKTDEVAKTTDNAAARYTPTPSENVSETDQAQQQKPLKDSLSEGMGAAKDTGSGAAAAAGAGTMGVASASDEDDNRDMSGGKKSMLEQAKEKIFGSLDEGSQQRPSAAGDEQLQKAGKSKPTITSRAAGTVVSLKDTLASKLGYGAKRQVSEGTAQGEAMAMETAKASNQENAHDQSSKSVLQKLQDSAAGATGAVASKLGYGEQQKTHQQGLDGNSGKNDNQKSYVQKMQQTAYEAKGAVASKLGYGSSSPTRDVKDEGTDPEQKSYMQKMQETAVGAKDVVASKLGYTHSSSFDGEFPASTGTTLGVTEGTYRDDENAPTANTTARFHPGEEERALSQLITEKMSIGAATVKDAFLKPFGRSPSTPTTTMPPPPPAAPTLADDKADNIVVSANDDTNTGVNTPHATIGGEEEPGIVGKESGSVSSLLVGTSASAAKERENEAACCKANEDTNAAATVEMH